MKRVRVQRIAGQWLTASAARPPVLSAAFPSLPSSLPSPLSSPPPSPLSSPPSTSTQHVFRRCQSNLAEASTSATASAGSSSSNTSPLPPSFPSFAASNIFSTRSLANTAPALGPSTDPRFPELFADAATSSAYPSPAPARARSSAKLATLHARMGLSQRVPLETLARTLVDASADASASFNNASLAYLGSTLINYHVCEWLLCRYPRLPMVILYEAMRAYAGPQALTDVARQFGVEAAAVPGGEVDPGLLQFSLAGARQGETARWGYTRVEAAYLKKFKWRHGISSRVVLDDDFGDLVERPSDDAGAETQQEAAAADAAQDAPDAQSPLPTAQQVGGSMDAEAKTRIADEAHANFVRAVAGAVYAHAGREALRSFVRAHILSRQLDLERLFRFQLPTRELAYLCARENFEPPVARLESETGRRSRTPVFVVGIYSGSDKIGEGVASSLDHARAKAAMNSLKSWYLYSPGEDVRVPSDMLLEGAAPWEPAYVDIGEIL